MSEGFSWKERIFLGSFCGWRIDDRALRWKPSLPATVMRPTVSVRAQIRYGGLASTCTAGLYNDRDDLAFTVQGPSLTQLAPKTSATQGRSAPGR